MSERVYISDGVGNDDAVCPLVEGFRNVSESLLSCSVPYVQCDVAKPYTGEEG